jgi:uncharacterized membrane protein affecting hemolysin expression
MPLIHYLRAHPQQLLCSLVLLLAGIVGAALYLNHSQRVQLVQAERYGQALADIAARQAVDAALSQDMISLQVVLRELTRHPNVVGATMHDVENRLLVQSGYTPDRAERKNYLGFTATVALHNNIAGYLRVNLRAPGHSTEQWIFVWSWLGLLLAAIALLWLTPHLRARARAITEESQPLEEEEGPAEPQAAVRLSLHLCNIGTLYNQLNSRGFNALMAHFEQQLRSVLALYSGRKQLLWGDVLIVDFSGEDATDCTFRALCCAELLRKLAGSYSGPSLQLSASIQALPDPQSSADLKAQFIAQYSERRAPEAGNILIAAPLVDASLLHHADIGSGTGELVGINPPYRAMLDRQEQQLANAAATQQ